MIYNHGARCTDLSGHTASVSACRADAALPLAVTPPPHTHTIYIYI